MTTKNSDKWPRVTNVIKVDPQALSIYRAMDEATQLELVMRNVGKSSQNTVFHDLVGIAATTPYHTVQEQLAIITTPRVEVNGKTIITLCEPLLPALRVNPKLAEPIKQILDAVINLFDNMVPQEPVKATGFFEYRFIWVDNNKQRFFTRIGANFRGVAEWTGPLEVYGIVDRLPGLRGADNTDKL